MHNKTAKTGTALEFAMVNMANLYGASNCRVATVTLRGKQTMYVLGKKLTVLLRHLKPHFPSMIAVCSLLEDSAHVHLLLAMKEGGPTVEELKKIFRSAKSNAKFGFLYDFEPIRTTPEHVAGYFKKNYYDFMEARKMDRRNKKGRAIRMINVPQKLKLDMKSFDSYNPAMANSRRILTRLAEIYGVEGDDMKSLSHRMRLPAWKIRQVTFDLLNTTPGRPTRWPVSRIREVVSQKRQQYVMDLTAAQERDCSSSETVGTAEDFFVRSSTCHHGSSNRPSSYRYLLD